jgi:hypothetical protein
MTDGPTVGAGPPGVFALTLHTSSRRPLLAQLLFTALACENWRLTADLGARHHARRPHSVNVRSCRRASRYPEQPARSTTKWRFGPSKKRHFPSFSATFSTIFSVFFHERAFEGAIGREGQLADIRLYIVGPRGHGAFDRGLRRARRAERSTGVPDLCGDQLPQGLDVPGNRFERVGRRFVLEHDVSRIARLAEDADHTRQIGFFLGSSAAALDLGFHLHVESIGRQLGDLGIWVRSMEVGRRSP